MALATIERKLLQNCSIPWLGVVGARIGCCSNRNLVGWTCQPLYLGNAMTPKDARNVRREGATKFRAFISTYILAHSVSSTLVTPHVARKHLFIKLFVYLNVKSWVFRLCPVAITCRWFNGSKEMWPSYPVVVSHVWSAQRSAFFTAHIHQERLESESVQ